MKKNIGTADRVGRFILGAAILVGAYFAWPSLYLVFILAAGGLFCIAEALIGWCALNALLGKNTCPIER